MTAPDIAAVPQFSRDEKMDKRTELDVEDSYYLLHALESEAFSCVVTAMRAQGMLTEYKQILLEHLKTALFVSDATYKAEMRRAANDEVLCKIAETLNPSYDSFVQWGMAANDIIPPAFNQIPLYADQDIEGLDVAGQLLRLANSHNSAVDNYNDALHELITLPKAPFVPEKLRILLRETESDPSERLDLNFNDNAELLESRSKKCLVGSEKRTKKFRTSQKNIKQEKPDIPVPSNSCFKTEFASQSSNPLNIIRQKAVLEDLEEKQISLMENGVQNVRQVVESSTSIGKTGEIHSHSLSTSAVLFPSFEACDLSQNTTGERIQQKAEAKKSNLFKPMEGKDYPKFADERKWKRKKSKQRENNKDTCARVRPFLFESCSPGQMKPPRGNPDRRATKRTSPTFSCQTQTNVSSSAAGLSPQSYSTSTSRGPVYTSLSPNISRFASSQGGFHSSGVIIKRMRTSSSGETNSSHNGFYNRATENNAPVKTSQLSERSYSRVIVPPSQSAGAWSNPTRPYYGNPSAAAMGVTVRSSPISNNGSNICTSNAGTSVEKVLQSPQTAGNIGDPQQLSSRHFSSSPVFVTVGHQQSKVATRRSSYSSKSATVGNSVSVHLSPIPNGGGPGGIPSYKNPSSPGEQYECSYRSNSSSASHSSSASVSSLFSSRCVDYASNFQSQNVVVSQASNLASHPDGTHIQSNYLIQGGKQTGVVDRSGSGVDIIVKDDTLNSMNSDECTSTHEVRLECDEVMAPENRCIICPRSSDAISPLPVQIKHVLHAGDVAPRVSQQISMLLSYENREPNEMHLNRVVEPQFINGLLHQDDQEIVGLITSGQCIR